jgi:hypothetical protein
MTRTEHYNKVVSEAYDKLNEVVKSFRGHSELMEYACDIADIREKLSMLLDAHDKQDKLFKQIAESVAEFINENGAIPTEILVQVKFDGDNENTIRGCETIAYLSDRSIDNEVLYYTNKLDEIRELCNPNNTMVDWHIVSFIGVNKL